MAQSSTNVKILDEGDPVELGAQYAALRRSHPQIAVLGGCCGTDHRHVEQIDAACRFGRLIETHRRAELADFSNRSRDTHTSAATERFVTFGSYLGGAVIARPNKGDERCRHLDN